MKRTDTESRNQVHTGFADLEAECFMATEELLQWIVSLQKIARAGEIVYS